MLFNILSMQIMKHASKTNHHTTFHFKVTFPRNFLPWIFCLYTAWKVSKYGPEKTPHLDTFHAVITTQVLFSRMQIGYGNLRVITSQYPWSVQLFYRKVMENVLSEPISHNGSEQQINNSKTKFHKPHHCL